MVLSSAFQSWGAARGLGAELAGDDDDRDHQLEELAERVAALALE